MMRNTQYNCKLGKGCGLIEETLSLLEIYQDGMTIDALLEYVHQSNTLSKCTELRTKDIVKLGTVVKFRHYESIGRLSR